MISGKITLFEERIKVILANSKFDHIVVTYSGGKDSTALVNLVVHFFSRNKDLSKVKLVILHGDTLVENPLVHACASSFLDKLYKWARNYLPNLTICVFRPDYVDTFWVNIIGKGYPMPAPWNRWCQNHLKIKPAKLAIKRFGFSAVLHALRISESMARKKSLEKRLNEFCVKVNKDYIEYAPLFDWSEQEIWYYLIMSETPWGERFDNVIELYNRSSEGCLLSTSGLGGNQVCGSRFGCWVCSVVREDKTLQRLSLESPLLKRLFEFKKWLVHYSSLKRNRYPITRKGTPAKNGMGTLTIEARKEILARLLDLQNELNTKLITETELMAIEYFQKIDLERFSDLIRIPEKSSFCS